MARIERIIRRQRLFTYIRVAVYVILILGVAAYLAGLYTHADEWRAEVAGTPDVGVKSPTTITLAVPVNIYNPDGDVMIRNLYYRIYVNGEYVGDGFKPYLQLPHGNTTVDFKLEVNLLSLGCGTAKAFQQHEDITIRVEGLLQFDVKAFGVIPWKTVTVPFNTTAKKIQPPPIPQEATAPLQLRTLICENPGAIAQILQTLESAAQQGGQPGTGGAWGYPFPGGG